MLMHLNDFSAKSWMDDRLAWNESDFGGVSEVHLPPGDVWKPDIFAFNRYIGCY